MKDNVEYKDEESYEIWQRILNPTERKVLSISIPVAILIIVSVISSLYLL